MAKRQTVDKQLTDDKIAYQRAVKKEQNRIDRQQFNDLNQIVNGDYITLF